MITGVGPIFSRRTKRRWEALKTELHAQLKKYGESSDQFSEFLTGFTGFCNWLSEIRGQLLDELCVAIPHKASGDTIATHKARLKVRERGGEREGMHIGICYPIWTLHSTIHMYICNIRTYVRA